MYSSAKKLHRVLTSGEIRKTFINYFINHDHKFVRSSPVVPFCDPTVAFVNSGMNQFKSIFLGKTQPTYTRVTNSQKCIRVGGKHNDLSVVGQDGYHHTFFEMLGNWSFGDYFKREACEMSLDLLRGPYNIDPNRLYVTYFGGDEILGLPADMECFEIWRSLGFPAERILPFGVKDNFWEMGNTGPCGPCTEIHIDHRPDLGNSSERAKLVNAGLPDITEIWNLVFIQYNRNENGSITQLPSRHVDTGMGFERLTAILQNKSSNYDTDLFKPIFNSIEKITKAPTYAGQFATDNCNVTLDTGYRVIADHARMITVCLADGMLPDQNQKLRRILRKALTVSENVFGYEQLLSQLVPVVIETLGDAYPELNNKQKSILELIEHEHEVFRALRETSTKAFTDIISEFPNLDDFELMQCPGFVSAYRDFQQQKPAFQDAIIPGTFLYKLADTYGLSEETFHKLAEIEKMTCDMQGYRDTVTNAKLKSKSTTSNADKNDTNYLSPAIMDGLCSLTSDLSITNNSFKYIYSFNSTNNMYELPTITTKISGIFYNGCKAEKIKLLNNDENIIYIITNDSNFYHESGGQQSDSGKILVKDGVELNVIKTLMINDCIVHVCKNSSNINTDIMLAIDDEVKLVVDSENRTMNTLHHTACHLLNSAIRNLFQRVTYQVSSSVTSEYCKLEVGLIGKRITKEDIESIEDLIGRIICSNVPINVKTINAADVLEQNDITMVPGEIYPEEGLRLISLDCKEQELISKELCCGTHANNTHEIDFFCITNLKQTNRARYAFTAVAGKVAENVLKNAALIGCRVDALEQQFKTDKQTNATEIELQKIRNSLNHTDMVFPYVFKIQTIERINDLLKKLKETSRTTLKEFVEVEMKNLLQEKPHQTHPYILHYMKSSALMEEVPLAKATRLCVDRPILVIGKCDDTIKARCCVPSKFINKNFNAEKWLQIFASTFKASVSPPKGQNSAEVCNMKGKKVSTQFEEQLEVAMLKANEYAKKYLM